MLRMPMSSSSLPVRGLGIPVVATAPGRHALTPARLRVALIGGAVVAATLGTILTSGDTAARAALEAGPELTRLLRMMTLLKVTLGVGALALVSLRFRFPISTPLAAGYIAAGCIMSAGPGAMWNMAHIGLGALLLHGGLAALFALAWIDGGTKWPLGRHDR
jgi:hypothetical protein